MSEKNQADRARIKDTAESPFNPIFFGSLGATMLTLNPNHVRFHLSVGEGDT